MISNKNFADSCEQYKKEQGRDPRVDDLGNLRSQVNIVKTLNKWRLEKTIGVMNAKEFNDWCWQEPTERFKLLYFNIWKESESGKKSLAEAEKALEQYNLSQNKQLQ